MLIEIYARGGGSRHLLRNAIWPKEGNPTPRRPKAREPLLFGGRRSQLSRPILRLIVEDDHLAGHCELMDEAAVVDIVQQIGVGGRAPNPGWCRPDRARPSRAGRSAQPSSRQDPSLRPSNKPSRAAPPPPGVAPGACSPGRLRPSSSDRAGEGSPSARRNPRRRAP